MKTLRTTLIASLAVLSLGAAAGGAQAQTQDASSTQPNAHRAHRLQGQALTPEQRAQFAAKRAQFAAQRAAKLHDALKITPQQESAWTAFVASMQPPARAQSPADRAAWASLSAPERAAKLIELQKQHVAQSERRLDALNTFYSVLTPDQKKTFDTQAARLQARWGHGGRHGARGAWQKRPAPTAQG
jgi:Spy/CpxP family protein refolding chaperone